MAAWFSVKGLVLRVVLAALTVLPAAVLAQPIYFRWNTFTVNKIANRFSNYGSICEGQFVYGMGQHPAMEYPAGSGNEYGMAIGFHTAGLTEDGGGANPDNLPYFDMTPQEYEDNWDKAHWDPYGPGPYENDVPLTGVFNFVGNSQAAPMSTDVNSWPDPANADGRYGWPAVFPHTGEPVQLNANGWPGWGPNGEQIGHQESFGVAYSVNHVSEVPPERWMKTQMVFRGMAFTGKLYENYIFWLYEITNIGTKPITGCYLGIRMDYAFVWNRNGVTEEVQAFDRDRQLAYAYNPQGVGLTESGRVVSPTAFAGVSFLKTPKRDDGTETGIATVSWSLDPGAGDEGKIMENYYTRNVLNQGSPYDTDGDGIDDTHVRDGVPYNYGWTPSGWNAANWSMINAGPVTLDPGEKDTLIVCTVMGSNLLDLRKNADRARNLYRSGFQIAEPPVQPSVTVTGGDRKITLTWGKESESSPGFEGYRIYRSKDNGATWGDRVVTDPNGTQIGYVPLAQFDLRNGIVGPSTNPEATWLDFGSDTGLPVTNEEGQYEFTDENLINGLTYRYYIAAYNVGSASQPPVENSPATNPSVAADNTVEVTPRSPLAAGTLSEVRVVPNPYISTNDYETDPSVREIHFTHLPGPCTIRVYNVAGELMVTLEHTENTSEQKWNVRTANNQEVAPGLYIYHVSAPGIAGEKIGKFAVIK
ncbi:MAG: hypothetical protein IT282_06405 [Bacteroidetes bacterium]|nr:hypothetical protein [Bacteroidota bacterium]